MQPGRPEAKTPCAKPDVRDAFRGFPLNKRKFSKRHCQGTGSSWLCQPACGPSGGWPRIEEITGVKYHKGHAWNILRRLGWNSQRPVGWALERRPPLPMEEKAM